VVTTNKGGAEGEFIIVNCFSIYWFRKKYIDKSVLEFFF
jgi:hypothetical protein